ncbi:Cysteine--tRNA ligase [Geodia barretti]|uniref:Cysteine--tRNA ligase, cytoplasmic n=1 Tax=Geodia barretti TaxID=519541 RepID=A0AA35R0I8_GEOBA|nr:Cysteine--tRNA ligase [Geodia barretti]
MKLYNTLSGQVEEFVPSDGNLVKMYVCGVTPYSSTHVGHALSYVMFDTLRRYLEHKGYEVRHVQNFTDIDDKIIQRAQESGVSEDELVEEFIGDYFDTMDALNIQRASEYPRATREIPRIIDAISGLIDRGHAYPAAGDVYFRVTSKDDYGKLSHRTLDSMIAGARIQVDENKEHPMDFVLWKGAKPGEPSWESPWGPGRPGWHIECTAMSLEYLGEQLDIHGGGQDLVFPHHENEIAQSECYTGAKPFSRYWMHNGLLQLGSDKMSKSLGNLVSVVEALERYSPDAIRLYFLSSHYRSPLAYSDEGAAAVERSLERVRRALIPGNGAGAEVEADTHRVRFAAAMDDDLNTPQAVAALFDLARDINRGRDAGQSVGSGQAALRELGAVLGLTFVDRPAPEADLAATPFIDLLVSVRTELRAARQFALADQIRDGLAEQGVSLEDGAQGTQWQRQTTE